jgi:2-iminobutanoate/2-iminopropanoate deaminase
MKAIYTPDAPQPAGPYSQAVLAGGFVFVSGQRPTDPATGQIVVGTEAQTHQVLRNIRAVLQAAGADMRDVVRVTAHLADLSDFDIYNSVYVQYFQEPYPSRTTTGSDLRGIRVEIDVIAHRGENP